MNVCEQARKDTEIEQKNKVQALKEEVVKKLGKEYEKFIIEGHYRYTVIIKTCWDNRQIEFSYKNFRDGADVALWWMRCTSCGYVWYPRGYERTLNETSRSEILENIRCRKQCKCCEIERLEKQYDRCKKQWWNNLGRRIKC